jgi:hypothetical protein
MDQTHAHATIMCDMLDRLRAAGMMDPTIDVQAEPT